MLPAASVAGVPVLTIDRSGVEAVAVDVPVTSVVAVELLLSWFVSPGSPSTLAVLMAMPVLLSVAVTVSVAGVPDGTVAMRGPATPVAVVKVVPGGTTGDRDIGGPGRQEVGHGDGRGGRRGGEVGHDQGVSLRAADAERSRTAGLDDREIRSRGSRGRAGHGCRSRRVVVGLIGVTRQAFHVGGVDVNTRRS